MTKPIFFATIATALIACATPDPGADLDFAADALGKSALTKYGPRGVDPYKVTVVDCPGSRQHIGTASCSAWGTLKQALKECQRQLEAELRPWIMLNVCGKCTTPGCVPQCNRTEHFIQVLDPIANDVIAGCEARRAGRGRYHVICTEAYASASVSCSCDKAGKDADGSTDKKE